MPTAATSTKPNIIVDHVSKSFGKRSPRSLKNALIRGVTRKPVRARHFKALDDVSLVNEGDAVAVFGYSGSGKPTTFKLVSDVLEPDAGGVLTRGWVAGLIEAGARFHPDLTGREKVFLTAGILGISEKQTQARFNDIVAFSEIGQFIDQEVKHCYSGTFVELDVLLVDELLAVGDAPFRRKCVEKVKELTASGVTILVVSHSKGMIKQLCKRGIVISKGKVIFDGPIDEAREFLETN